MSEHVIHEAIEATANDNVKLSDSVLVGWVVIAEWVAGDGTRSLVKLSGTPGGVAPPIWQSRGYLHEALFGNWDNQ